MHLTRNFTVEELTLSQTAVRKGIDNTVPLELRDNLNRLAHFLQELRDNLSLYMRKDTGIIISSAYRCPALNKAIGGSPTSAHPKALAADIHVNALTPLELALFIEREMQSCGYDQVIHEFGRWVHVGLADLNVAEPRLQSLTATRENGRTIYLPGLQPVIH